MPFTVQDPSRTSHTSSTPSPRTHSSPQAAALRVTLAIASGLVLQPTPVPALENVYLTGVPDYAWHAGCFGTATGNLAGFWDRHGFEDLYTGPTGDGVAPLHSFGANINIRALWASAAGLDGRPLSSPGHMDDYYTDYQDTGPDPYTLRGRTEHNPDCIGDFIGLNQRKWPDLGGECAGNIDGYAFNFFDRNGARRDNFTPTSATGQAIPDIQSGLRAWARWRGVTADTFSQFTDFNPYSAPGKGFTFAELKAEIDAGYPVLLFMQPFAELSRTVGGLRGLNPEIHAMLAYGYLVQDDGTAYVRYRTSWASGDREFSPWTSADWTPEQALNLPLRGVIGFHPRPQLRPPELVAGRLRLRWQGPLSVLRDDLGGTESPVHRYIVERALPGAGELRWESVTEPAATLTADIAVTPAQASALYRIRLVPQAGL